MSSPHQSLRDRALFKAWLVWENGAKKTFYSFDTSGKYHVEDKRAHGLRSLKKMTAGFLAVGGPIRQAIIYDNQSGQLHEQLIRGQWIPAALIKEFYERLQLEAALHAATPDRLRA